MFNFVKKHSDKIIGTLIFLVGWLLLLAVMRDVYLIWLFFRTIAWPEIIMHAVCTGIIWMWGYKVFFHKD